MGIGVDLSGKVEQYSAARLVARLGPGIDSSLSETLLRVAHDERLIVFQHRAEAVAVGARAARIVEGEEGRSHRNGRRIAVAAGRELGEAIALGRGCRV